MDRYDPWDAAIRDDPYPAYRWLRDKHPRYRQDELDFYVLSLHEDVKGALRDPERLISGDGVARIPSTELVMVGDDPPEHTRLRRVGARAFTRPAMARHEERIRALAYQLVDGAVENGTVDAIADVADPFILEALTGVLGVPNDQPDAMLAMTEAAFTQISARDDPGPLPPVVFDVGARIDPVVEERKRSGKAGSGDLVDAVVAHAEPDADGWRLDRFGRATFVTSLITPGIDTTRNLIGNALHAFARHPEQWERFRAGETTAADVVEEALRYEAPVQGFFRTVVEPFEAAGGEVPAGARVLLLFGSANRDERVFDDPDRFDVGRRPTDHLAFGSGIHFCLGAGLARLEGAALFDALRELAARFELAGTGQRSPDALLRGWRSLPLTLVPA